MNFKATIGKIMVYAFWGCVVSVLVKASLTASQPCPAGYTGSSCSTNIDDCVNINCSGSGNCSDRTDGFVCLCNDRFFGLNCEIEALPCSPNPCENNGSCSQDGSLIKCDCTADFEGDSCETAKPQRVFTITLTMVQRNYSLNYTDLTHFVSRALITTLTNIFTPFFERTFEGFLSILFRELFPGSVGAIFDVTFAASSKVNETSIIRELRKANGTAQLNFELFGTLITVRENLPTDATPSAPTESPNLEPWIIALIVSLATVFILLLIIAVLILKISQEQKLSKQLGIIYDGHWVNQADIKEH